MTDWTTRHTLLQRAKNPDDQQAWNEFVGYYKPFVDVVLYQMNYRKSDREDVVQEVLLKIWKNLHKYEVGKEKSRFRSWLSTLIRNRVLDHIKSDKRFEIRNESAKEEMKQEMSHIVTQPEVEEIVKKEWAQYIAKLALDNIRSVFSGKAIEVFEMSLKGKSNEEIADEVGIQKGSVNKLKNRVKARLIEEVQELRENLEFNDIQQT